MPFPQTDLFFPLMVFFLYLNGGSSFTLKLIECGWEKKREIMKCTFNLTVGIFYYKNISAVQHLIMLTQSTKISQAIKLLMVIKVCLRQKNLPPRGRNKKINEKQKMRSKSEKKKCRLKRGLSFARSNFSVLFMIGNYTQA